MLAHLGPHLGCLLRAPDPQPQASPSPRFNYVIDFRFGRIGTPLPPTGLHLSVPFLSLRVLLTGCNLETAPEAASVLSRCRLALHFNEMVLPGSARAGSAASPPRGTLRLWSCSFAFLNYFVLHYSLIEKRSVFELSLHAWGWAGAGPPAVLSPPHPDQGCIGRSALGSAEARRRLWARRGAPDGLPRFRPAPAAQKRPEKQIWPQLSTTTRLSGTFGLTTHSPQSALSRWV